jgi:transposase
MRHIAIDLGGRESQICVREADGTVVEERRVGTGLLKEYLRRQEAAQVVVETCAESFAVADAAVASGHRVRVVPATLAPSLGVGARRIKTDRRDAQVLSEVSCQLKELHSVHVPSAASREHKAVVHLREALVKSRTLLVNSVRGYLRTQLIRVPGGVVETFPRRIRQYLIEKCQREVSDFVERQLLAIESLTEQIRVADRDVSRRAKNTPVCRRLMTVPGVGPVTALFFAATVDDVSRFDNGHRVASFLGLTPGESSSSDSKHRLSITKAGSSTMRWLLQQAAWSALRARRLDPLQRWMRNVEARRGRRIAIVALARKLAGVMYAIWKGGEGVTYQAHLAASEPAT